MALPPLTPEQRAAALEKAAVARRERAAVKNRLKYSQGSLAEVIAEGKDNDVIGKMKVSALLESLPGVGQGPRAPDHAGGRHLREPAGPRTRPEPDLRPADPASTRRERPRPRRRPPRLTVLAGPTAVGKGTVAAYIRDHFPEVWLSVSATTRTPRPGEVDGVHYHFVDDAEFDRMVAGGRAARVRPSCTAASYGTPARPGGGGAGRRADGPARDRPAGRPPGPRGHARRPSSSSSRRPAGRSWCDGSSAGAPRPRRSARRRLADRQARARRSGGVRRHHRQRRGSAMRREELVSLMRSHVTDRPPHRNSIEKTSVSGTVANPIGITNPPIDDLLERRRLQVRPGDLLGQARAPDQRVLLPAAGGPARVRRPAGETAGAREAAVDRPARDQRGAADLRRRSRAEQDSRGPGTPACASSWGSAEASRPTRRARCCACSPRPATTSPSCRPPRRCSSSARRPGRRCPASRSRPRSGRPSTRSRTSGSGRAPTSSSWRRPPPTCSPGPRPAWPTTC